ncbi:flagellar protein FlaG [Sporolactobacillus kofuensis]|uniref:Flagellar protein FlaG n=1 Tax=Sporolactobacillus kofuensis TaxID=269672 RepID=A0ABW1WF62_9BACL|nr:flagellar protein FlaG [Sporolactobacillus kofuensis]MCO7176448.1 flagellar protein FlaG [Sporolactobacillus kofuensis]
MNESISSINIDPSIQNDYSTEQITERSKEINKVQANQSQEQDLTKNQAKKLVDEANKLLQPEVTELKYVYFDKLQTYYVQLQDVNTHQVIREIPPKKFLEMYASIAEKLGLIINDRA